MGAAPGGAASTWFSDQVAHRIPCLARASPSLRVANPPGEGSAESMSSEQVPESTEAAEYRQSVLSEISREMVRLYKEQFGRGPTKAKTNFAGPDIVLVTLEE